MNILAKTLLALLAAAFGGCSLFGIAIVSELGEGVDPVSILLIALGFGLCGLFLWLAFWGKR